MGRSDAELVIATLSGDHDAFEAIIRRYQQLVFNIVFHYLRRRDDVEDIAQEVFLKLYRSLDRFDASRSLKAWIGRIASNACLDELRRRRTRRMSSFSDYTEEEEDRICYLYDKTRSGEGLSDVEADESFALLHKAMQDLNEKDRLAFVLREVEGLEYDEIAAALDASQVAARIRVSRARKKLQEKMQKLIAQRPM